MSRVTIAIIEAFGKRYSGIFVPFSLSFFLHFSQLFLFVTEVEKRRRELAAVDT